MQERVVFVSGHLDVTADEFAAHYPPVLASMINEGVRSFILGGGCGVDAMAQDWLARHPKSGQLHITVYDKKLENNVRFSGVHHCNGFTSYPARDEIMTERSTEDLAFIRDRGGMGSGTFQNVLRRALGTGVARAMTDMIRSAPKSFVMTLDEVASYLREERKIGELGDQCVAMARERLLAEVEK